MHLGSSLPLWLFFSSSLPLYAYTHPRLTQLRGLPEEIDLVGGLCPTSSCPACFYILCHPSARSVFHHLAPQ